MYQNGDIAWTLAGTALVFIMIPGLGYFYSGLLRRKNALSMIYMSMMTLAVVSFQWFFWGYCKLSVYPTSCHSTLLISFFFSLRTALAFSETGSAFIGDLKGDSEKQK